MRSGFSDVRTADVAPAKPKFLTDDELAEIIREDQEAEAGDGNYDHDEPSSSVR